MLKNMAALTEKERVNKTAMLCHLFVAAVLILSYLAEVLKGTKTVTYFLVVLALGAIPVMIELISYSKNHETEVVRHAAGFGYAVFYIFMIFTSPNILAFTYCIPMYIVITLFADVKYCVEIVSGGFLVNIIYVVSGFMRGTLTADSLENTEIQLALMLLVSIYTVLTTLMNVYNTKQRIEEVNEEKKKITTVLDGVMEVSNRMKEGIASVDQHMQKLGSTVASTRDAMQEVSSGTNETAESMQSQLGQTEDIQKQIDTVSGVSDSIKESIVKTNDAISVGRNNVEKLEAGAEDSRKAGEQVIAEMSNLSEYTKNMQGIIDMITSVASQTSMLALNASIEAARAGEAGRGFAVVATQISALANQTKSSTVSITQVIENVSDKLEEAVSAVQKLMDNNSRQNDAAEQTADSLSRITENASDIEDKSRQLAEVISKLIQANNVITESVQTMSAITEEVTAHASETLNASEENSETVQNVSEIVKKLTEYTAKLEQVEQGLSGR